MIILIEINDQNKILFLMNTKTPENEIEKPRIKVRIRTDDQSQNFANNGLRIKIKDKNGNEYESVGIPTISKDQKPLSLLPVYEPNDGNTTSPRKTVKVCIKGNGQVIESKVLNQVSGFKIVLNNQNNEIKVQQREASFEPQQPPPQQKEEWNPIEGNNNEFTGKKFGLAMTLHESNYNNGQKVRELFENTPLNGTTKTFAVTLVKDNGPFLNPAGLKLDLAEPNIEGDVYQQFTFGKTSWDTVVDSFVRPGMVFDVANAEELNPREGTAFYLFPFHGRHNQHFVFRNGMIYAMQNGHVVTYVGGDVPFVLMKPKESLRERQTFHIQLC